MNDNKGQTIFLSVIGIATLLVAIVGATFAWFSATVDNPDSASNSVIIKAASLGTVTFRNGDTISATDIYPGWSATKTVSLETDANATAEIPYTVTLHVVTNGFSTAGATSGYVRYAVAATDSNAGTYQTAVPATNIIGTTDVTVIRGTLGVAGAGASNANVKHTYTITFDFPELGSNQNSQQQAQFNAYLTAETDTRYTWNGGQSEYAG